jgi:putative ABC transport system permease protein
MTLVGVAAKNVLRNKFRSVFTIVGIAVAVLTFILIRTVLYAWTSAADYAQKDRLVTRNKVTFVMGLPKKYIDDVRNHVDGVKVATYANWFGGKSTDQAHEREFFGTFAVDENYFDVFSEMSVSDDQMKAWKSDKQGCIVGDVLAKKLGWKVGDRITLASSIYPAADGGDWSFNVDGIYTTTAKSVDRSTFLFHWAYMNDGLPESRRDEIGWMVARVADGTSPADLSVTIDKHFEGEDIQTLSQDERSFNASFLAGVSAVLTALNFVSLAILVIMGLILGNTIAMGVRERTQEYGVLRAIGFRPGHITTFIVGESMVTAVAGGGLGLLISYPIVEKGMGRWLEENMGQFFPYFRIATKDALLAIALTLVLGAVAGLIPAVLASKLKVTEALRRVA